MDASAHRLPPRANLRHLVLDCLPRPLAGRPSATGDTVLALVLVVVAFLLLFGLLRSSGARWSKVYRTTLVTGVVLGLVISGVIALGGILFLHCPVLPSESSGTTNRAVGSP